MLISASCTSKLETQLSDLVNAKNLWTNSANYQAYSFEYVRHCFCLSSGQRIRVSVENGTIVALDSIGEDASLPRLDSDSFRTIPDMFQLILDLVESDLKDGASLQVEYDSEYGYPTIIEYDSRRGSDSAVRIELSKYRPM